MTVEIRRPFTDARRNQGFTLIELCFVILVSGLFSLMFLEYYAEYREKERVKITNDSLSVIEGALREFLSEEGYYPCPAAPGLPPNDPNYGQPDCNAARSGTRIVQGRDTNGDGVGDDVIIGSVPVKFLMNFYTVNNLEMDVPLTEFSSFDGWGQKLTYAVTKSQTVSRAAFDQRRGAIKVVDENNLDLTPIPSNAHFVIVSHGPNGVGGFSATGQRTENCTPITLPPVPVPGLIISPKNERDNCDYADNEFVSGLRNDNQFSRYDDLLKFYAFNQTDLWRPAATIDFKVYNTNAGFVGMNQAEPMQRLDVAGRVQAGQVISGKVCDQGGVNCMDVSVLAGDDRAIDCRASGRAVGQIRYNRAECRDYRVTPVASNCPTGQVVVGVNGNGTPICANRP